MVTSLSLLNPPSNRDTGPFGLLLKSSSEAKDARETTSPRKGPYSGRVKRLTRWAHNPKTPGFDSLGPLPTKTKETSLER